MTKIIMDKEINVTEPKEMSGKEVQSLIDILLIKDEHFKKVLDLHDCICPSIGCLNPSLVVRGEDSLCIDCIAGDLDIEKEVADYIKAKRVLEEKSLELVGKVEGNRNGN